MASSWILRRYQNVIEFLNKIERVGTVGIILNCGGSELKFVLLKRRNDSFDYNDDKDINNNTEDNATIVSLNCSLLWVLGFVCKLTIHRRITKPRKALMIFALNEVLNPRLLIPLYDTTIDLRISMDTTKFLNFNHFNS